MYLSKGAKEKNYKKFTRRLALTGKCWASDSSFCFICMMKMDDSISKNMLKSHSKVFAMDDKLFLVGY